MSSRSCSSWQYCRLRVRAECIGGFLFEVSECSGYSLALINSSHSWQNGLAERSRNVDTFKSALAEEQTLRTRCQKLRRDTSNGRGAVSNFVVQEVGGNLVREGIHAAEGG